MEKKKIYFAIIWILAVSLMVLIFIRVMVFIGNRAEDSLSKGSDGQEETTQEDSSMKEGEDQEGGEAEENSIDYNDLNDSEIYDLAVDSGDPIKCQKMKDKKLFDTCIALVARNSGNTSSCSMINDESKRVNCVDMTYFNKALSGNEGSECANIEDPALTKACVVNMINENEYSREDCSLFPASIRDYCDEYQIYLDDIALFKSAQSRNECERINNEAARVHCLDKFSL